MKNLGSMKQTLIKIVENKKIMQNKIHDFKSNVLNF